MAVDEVVEPALRAGELPAAHLDAAADVLDRPLSSMSARSAGRSAAV